MSTSVPQMEDKVPVVRYVPTMVVVRLAAVAKLVICFLDIAVLVGPILIILIKAIKCMLTCTCMRDMRNLFSIIS